ncbi:MAG TPA: hypothetical protein VG994_07165 [Steroidobacteraceae bacterium]|nr:hypothetical protein [Steroidobacteraceae bacterium]
MTAATIQDVSALTERESVFWYYVASINATMRNVVMWCFVPFFLVGALILAQLYPWRILKVLGLLKGVLPSIQNNDDLKLIRDMLRLAYGAGRFYRRLCLFRSSMQLALDELDEMIDSIAFVLCNEEQLQAFARASEAKNEAQRSPDLFRFERIAAR